MSFIKALRARGSVAQITHEDELLSHLESKQTIYMGIDPTAKSMHVGNLVSLMMLRRFQQAGHRIIILLGGGTAMVGDPTGKSEMRDMATQDDIDSRALALKKQIERFVDLSDSESAFMVNNADWLRGLQYLPFLREIGAHFNVNRMLDAECFKQRMDKGLSFLEFNYMIFQAYDFLELFKKHNCTIQVGGDDQWSNMLAGVDLVRKLKRGKAFCITCPLLVTSTGKKMGKTEKGAIWLNGELTSPFDFFQYFRNVEDQDVGKILRYLTDLPVSEIEELESLKDEKINGAKIRAAFEVTKIVHGEAEAEKAKAMAESLFSQDGANLQAPEVHIALQGRSDLALIDVLAEAKVCESKGEARRLIQQGGVLVDNEKVANDKVQLSSEQLQKGFMVRLGKKRFFKILFE